MWCVAICSKLILWQRVWCFSVTVQQRQEEKRQKEELYKEKDRERKRVQSSRKVYSVTCSICRSVYKLLKFESLISRFSEWKFAEYVACIFGVSFLIFSQSRDVSLVGHPRSQRWKHLLFLSMRTLQFRQLLMKVQKWALVQCQHLRVLVARYCNLSSRFSAYVSVSTCFFLTKMYLLTNAHLYF